MEIFVALIQLAALCIVLWTIRIAIDGVVSVRCRVEELSKDVNKLESDLDKLRSRNYELSCVLMEYRKKEKPRDGEMRDNSKVEIHSVECCSRAGVLK